jgi:hypothetical protein
MKVEDLIGKLVIRVQCRQRPRDGVGLMLGYGGGEQDCSFTSEPIRIEEIVNGIVFYRERKLGPVKVLQPQYRDDHWAEFPARLAENWEPREEAPAATQQKGEADGK